MRRKVIITTPYPTVEEVAAELGVSMKRVRELELMMEKIWERKKKVRSKTGGSKVKAVKRKTSHK
jgi:hypothetical protein